jgi:hypothetical protein
VGRRSQSLACPTLHETFFRILERDEQSHDDGQTGRGQQEADDAAADLEGSAGAGVGLGYLVLEFSLARISWLTSPRIADIVS